MSFTGSIGSELGCQGRNMLVVPKRYAGDFASAGGSASAGSCTPEAPSAAGVDVGVASSQALRDRLSLFLGSRRWDHPALE
jgi:hypothetical protein